jgi:DNA polymerase delta subunit 1
LVVSKDIWGFQNLEKKRFVKMTYPSLQAMRRDIWKYKDKHKLYESNIDPVLRFFHRTGIQSCGWIDTREFNGDWKTLKPFQCDTNAPFTVLSFDIECYSSDNSFPCPDKPDNCIFMIGLSWYQLGGSDDVHKQVLQGSDEKTLLCDFQKALQIIDPDIITGWNIFGFDLEYIVKRMNVCNVPTDAYVWGRNPEDYVTIVEKKLASSALGDNMLKLVPMTGRYVFDLMGEIKREHKLDNYKLNDVAYHFLKETKNDMTPKEIFASFRESKNLDIVADYCVQDTMLPVKLMKLLYTLENLIEMAKATWVPISYLSERGQQIKVYSQLARKARELGFFIPSNVPKPEGKFEGATVLEPECGSYYSPIMCLDFESLYPSIIIAHNLCYSSLVMNPIYLNIPGVEYETHGEHVFAQNVPSLLPEILKELKTLRKSAKKSMAQHKGTPLEAIFNGKQLAYKISMNSVYGFTGSSNGILPLVEIASTVTRKGRQMIEQTKEYIEEHYAGAKVRYGDTDSVMVDFGVSSLDEAWKLGEQASEECSKLFKSPNNLELENAYCPFILISKKRYFAKKITKKNDEYEYQDISKGLQDVRRDTCQYVRSALKQIQTQILNSKNAKEYAHEIITNLLSGSVPIEELYLSKQLRTGYKNQNLVHVQVAKKMKERSPGSEPQSGDRVRYVILEGPKKSRLYEKGEDPVYAVENKLKIDYRYYFENQLLTPLKDLFNNDNFLDQY